MRSKIRIWKNSGLMVLTVSALALAQAAQAMNSQPNTSSNNPSIIRIQDHEASEARLRVAQAESFHAIPYLWAAERSADGEYAFSGYVPTAQLQKFLKIRAQNVAADTSRIATGAPDDFINTSLAGLGALALATEGRVAYTGKTWAFVGRAETPEQAQAIRDALDAKIWQVSIETAAAAEEIPVVEEIPVASPYLWKVEIAPDSPIVISGNVPTDGMKKFLSVRAGNDAVVEVNTATGAPEGFAQDALAALEVAASLEKGVVGFDGFQWYINGTPSDPALDLASKLGAAHTPANAWVMTAEFPPAPIINIEPETAVSPAEEASSEETTTEDAVIVEAAEAEESKPATAVESETAEPEMEQKTETEPAQPETMVAEEQEPEPVPAEPEKPKLYRFAAHKDTDEAITLAGVVPAAPARSYLGVIAGKVPTDRLYIYEDAPDGFLNDAIAGVRALANLEEGDLLHQRGKWTLSGTARTPGIGDATKAMIAALPDANAWDVELAITPPEVLCQEHLTAFASENRILFNAGSARLVSASQEALDQLVIYLEECPGVPIHVEGHTDSDGPEEANLTLSVARAEAVVEALIERGVDISRLYAVGYGESLPIASNDTRDGKSRNRRIAFKVLESTR